MYIYYYLYVARITHYVYVYCIYSILYYCSIIIVGFFFFFVECDQMRRVNLFFTGKKFKKAYLQLRQPICICIIHTYHYIYKLIRRYIEYIILRFSFFFSKTQGESIHTRSCGAHMARRYI
jgi:hypothetical protein